MGSNCMPLVMVTASAMVEEQKDLLKVCNDLLTKPLAKQTLINCLLKHLEHSIVESSSNKGRSGDNIEYQDINLRLLPDDQRIALVEFVEIGDTENAIKLCVDLPSDLTNESKWLIEMLESFELAKILDRLNSIENPIS